MAKVGGSGGQGSGSAPKGEGQQPAQDPNSGEGVATPQQDTAVDQVVAATTAAVDDQVIDPSVGAESAQAPKLEKWTNPSGADVRLNLGGPKLVPPDKAAMFDVAYHKAIHRQAPQLQCPVEQLGRVCEIRARFASSINAGPSLEEEKAARMAVAAAKAVRDERSETQE